MNTPQPRSTSVFPRALHGAGLAIGTAALALALAACSPAGGDAAPPPVDAGTPAPVEPAPADEPQVADAGVLETHWQCGDESVAANYDRAAETVTLVHAGGELVLPLAVSASGARYADDNGNEFWTKAASGTLTLSGAPARECSQVEDGTAAD